MDSLASPYDVVERTRNKITLFCTAQYMVLDISGPPGSSDAGRNRPKGQTDTPSSLLWASEVGVRV